MNADLTRLIRLQQLETAADDARRRIADHPARIQELDARLQGARDGLADIKTRLATAGEKRRTEEKEVAGVQTRLAKYKDQLLEVKTNREYTAMLHEIETAQNDIHTREDRILEIMMESDELNAGVRKGEGELKAAEKEIAGERSVLDTEMVALQAEIDRTTAEREKLVADIDRHVLAIFETNRQGAERGRRRRSEGRVATICHVRLRPQSSMKSGEERVDHPVRQLSPHSLFRGQTRSVGARLPV